MGTFFIGTCGYDYPKDWQGLFYPPRLRRDDYLSHYAETFNAVELDYTFYTMPKAAALSAMRSKTGGRLKFSVKAHQDLTHHIEICSWRGVAAEFKTALYPLLKDNALTSVLLQFPQSFHYEKDTRIYLDTLIKELSPLPLTVEFRNSAWQQDRVYNGLNQLGASLSMVDMPEIRHLPDFKPVICSSHAYMRFHGRNKKNWYNTNSTERYDYFYTDEELTAFIPLLKSINSRAKTTQIYFNNHAKASAPQNAQKLMSLLTA
jgi:uncharacterized protein YecE (DUF72 family)